LKLGFESEVRVKNGNEKKRREDNFEMRVRKEKGLVSKEKKIKTLQ
jgi:hypothetical protein